MSISASAASAGNPVLARLIAESSGIRQRFDGLTAQASTGMKATNFSGLGSGASTALSLAPQISSLQQARSNIDAADGALQIAQTAFSQIGTIASGLLSRLTGLNGLNPQTIDTAASSARDALAQVANLLNSRFGEVYVFAGEDSANPPVPKPDEITSAGFYTQIADAVAGLSANGADATAAATLAAAGSNAPDTSPFSAYLSQPAAALQPPSVSTGPGQSRTLGLLASANTGVVSGGGSTTGSYMRDLMRALATMGSLSSRQVNDPGFAPLVANTRTSLSAASSAMAMDAGVLGDKQSSLISLKSHLSDTETALSGQLSHVQSVDMATVLSNLTLTQTQLQASYQLISASNGMSLVKFLPGG